MPFFSVKKRFEEFFRSLDPDEIEQFKAYMQIEFERSISKLISDVQSNADHQQHAHSSFAASAITSSNQPQHETISPVFGNLSSKLSAHTTANLNATRNLHNSNIQQHFNPNKIPGGTLIQQTAQNKCPTFLRATPSNKNANKTRFDFITLNCN